MLNLSRCTLLILVASASAFLAAETSETSCYDEPSEFEYEWFDEDIAKDITLKSEIPAVVYYEIADSSEQFNVRISTKVFAAPGKVAGDDSTIYETGNITVAVQVSDAEDEASGSTMSAQGKSVAWIAASVLALFSVYGSRSKVFLTVLVVIALALAVPAAESADGEVDCATFGATSRVLIVVTFPIGTFDDYKIDVTGLHKDSHIESSQTLCDTCESGQDCAYGLNKMVSCPQSKGAMISDLTSFRWIADNCQDKPGSATLSGNEAGIVIFSHGWQNGGGLKKSNPCWRNEWKATAPVDTIKAWNDAGWAVGQVHWERLADEGEVKDAEMKIWSTSDNKKMRYKKDNGNYETRNVPTSTVPQMLWRQIKPQIKAHANSGKRVIFAGHSLGTQVISQLAYMYERDRDITTGRELDLWLLDAFFSTPRNWWGTKFRPGEKVRKELLPTVFKNGGANNGRVYRTQTSLANGPFSGDNEKDLANQVMFVEQSTNFFDGLLNGVIESGAKHNAAYVLFFQSLKGFSGSSGSSGTCKTNNGQNAPCALNTNKMHGLCWKQDQENGGRTVPTRDDVFKKGNNVGSSWGALKCEV